MESARLLRFSTVDRQYGPQEIRIRGSRFISFIYPISRESDISGIVGGLKKIYHDASHVCFAFRLEDRGSERFRHHDDGEPSGTAGLPIYNEIKGKDFFNVLVAVVRYFGGIKLGTGGLSRAYGQSAKTVLDSAEKISRYVMKRASISFSYQHTGEVRNLLGRFPVQVIGQDFSGNGVSMELQIPVLCFDELTAGLRGICRGNIEMHMEPG